MPQAGKSQRLARVGPAFARWGASGEEPVAQGQRRGLFAAMALILITAVTEGFRRWLPKTPK